MADLLEWAEPPTARNKALDELAGVVGQLRENPKRWAKITSPGRVNVKEAVKLGHGPFTPVGAFEAKRVTTGEGDAKVTDTYVRFIGDAPTEDAAREGDSHDNGERQFADSDDESPYEERAEDGRELRSEPW